MDRSEQYCSSYQENQLFLSRSYTSKEEFVREYRKLYYEKAKAEKFYLQVLTELENAISEGNIDHLKQLSKLIDYTSDVEDQVTLKSYYDNANNSLKTTNLVILTCKHNKVKILEHLCGKDTEILNNLSSIGIRRTILPDDKDEEHHNAFYYAIRSGNIDLLNTLINKWPDNYFAVHLDELEEILSKAYDELKLKNIPLSKVIEYFVEDKLINLRFFSDTIGQDESINGDLNNIGERIELVLQNIHLLTTEYSNTKEVDDKFLFVAKFIAQNIHILKRQLKSTYDKLPWEEIEFCLIIFVSSHIKQQDINQFYHTILNKNKILHHLENFARKLEGTKIFIKGVNICKLAELPKLKREKVVAEITSNCPQFKELYNNYHEIRDIYSLQKISDYIKLSLSADPKQTEGQLIITRALQVISEYLKNTLESPKLSSNTRELLLLSLPKNTREVIIDLRNSLSSIHSLSKREKIEENREFFVGIQNDTKKIGDVITNIFHSNKIKTVRILLRRISNTESLDEIKEVSKAFSIIQLDGIILGTFMMTAEYKKLEKLIEELSNSITEKTNHEQEIFNKINNTINFVKSESENIRTDYIKVYAALKRLTFGLSDEKIDHNFIRKIKFHVNNALENITVFQAESDGFKKIAELSSKLFHSIRPRIQDDNLDKISRLTCEIFHITGISTDDVKWIKELRKKLNKKGSFITICKQRKTYNITEEEEYDKQLVQKLSELKSILKNNALNGESVNNLFFYESNKKLQAVVEMFVLDIMSTFRSKNYLENNLLFLDDNTPLLTGKCLRNHLAHDNALVDEFLSNPSIAVILNANKLTSQNIMKSKKKLGKLVKEDPCKLKGKYDQSLMTIINQERMFVALEEGNLRNLKSYLKKGADINARNNKLWTALHFAAKGPSLEIIKFILNKNLDITVKDINGQSPLHIATAHGRKDIIKFFVEDLYLNVDELDNYGRTPLHIASQNGHKDAVEVLLRSKVNTVTSAVSDLSLPLFYAIKNNHVDVVKVLLEKDANCINNDIVSGHSPLHVATESGHLKLVNFLLQNKADVNARNDHGWTPLYIASFYGYLEVVIALIMKGAYVNASDVIGFTALHFAVANSHEKIANVLLKHGANVNAVEKIKNITPLHCAAENGHEGIVKALLKSKANASVTADTNVTPLHSSASSGNLKTVIALLKHGVNIHAKDKNNATPLYYAIGNGHKEVAELLIKNKANVNIRTCYSSTPLHIAATKEYKDIIDLLIKSNAEVNAQDVEGRTPLHLAAINGSKDIIDLLIKNKAEVNARTNSGMTPLYLAASNGHKDAVIFLIKFKADVNTEANNGLTPLHAAVFEGHKDVVNLLIKKKTKLDARSIAGSTPLHVAVEAGHEKIVEILVANGASVNIKSNNLTPLLSAVKYNYKKIVKVLIANGANVNAEPLLLATSSGYSDIVKIFLKKEVFVNIKYPNNVTLLHVATEKGHKEIANALIRRGADVDAVTTKNETPLHIAAQEGYEEIVKVLIASGANIDVKTDEGLLPLHMAAVGGHSNVIKVLLDNTANTNLKDGENRTPLELAVAHGHLQVVKMLLQYKKVDINAKNKEDWTILHIASQESNLELVKYLVNEGADINAKSAFGLKPIHIAAREGHKDTVEFFFNKGLSINELSTDSQTLLHYAATKNRLEVAEYLIAQGTDVNAKDHNDSTPMHIAAAFGCKDVIKVLLENGAVYNAVDKLGSRPLEVADDKDIIKLLASTEKLLEAAKLNNSLKVKSYIKEGAFVNARYPNNATPLHYAAWKGYDEVVNVLLQNKANPNAVGNNGFTPLHFAVKFSHLKVVKALLSNGAVYNPLSDGGKTPSDFTEDKIITSLFKLVNESFKKVKKGNTQVIIDINKIKDIDTVKAIMSARNRENETLIVSAVHNKFSKVEKLKQILQGDVSSQINFALTLSDQGDCQSALNILNGIFEKRKAILGPDNLGTLDIQACIAEVLFKQGAYHEVLNILENVFQKQKELLGSNHSDTLDTQYNLANVLFAQGEWIRALKAYGECFDKKKTACGSSHPIVSDILKKIEVINFMLKLHGTDAPETFQYVQKNIKTAASNGDIPTVQRLLNDGADVNEKDIDGRTPLHYAVSYGHVGVVNILLKYGADVTQVTNKGNTPLHTATSKSYKEIVEVLLQHVTPDKLDDFINTKTTSGGTTSLHVAAKSGSLETVKSLLEHGANYNIKNKENKTPIELSKDQKVTKLLKLVVELFEDAGNGNLGVINRLKALKPDEFLSVTNARNDQGHTLLQVVTINKHKNVTNN